MGHILCISSQKGGTGKTTTAVNLAASLAIYEKQTLLVDCDPLGNATTGLGINKKEISCDLYHMLIGRVPLQEVAVSTRLPFLTVLPARFNLIQAETKLAHYSGGKMILRSRLHELKHRFDYIILDSPPSLGFLAESAMLASDRLLVPLQYQIYALEGLGQLLLIIRQIREKYQIPLKIGGILFTMCQRYEDAGMYYAQACASGLKNHILRTVIPRDKLLHDSSNLAKPVVLHDIGSKGARAYLELACELMDLLGE